MRVRDRVRCEGVDESGDESPHLENVPHAVWVDELLDHVDRLCSQERGWRAWK